jgi:hypothetical protein
MRLCRKLKPDPCLSPCTRINSKWIKELNIRPATLNLVQERAGDTLEGMGIDNDFLSRTQEDGQMGLHVTEKLLHNKRNGL